MIYVYILSLVVNLPFAVVCCVKGKVFTGLLGLFLFPPVTWVGAVRLAHPDSSWFWHYGERKMTLSQRRFTGAGR